MKQNMSKPGKRLYSLLLILIMVMVILPVSLSAEEGGEQTEAQVTSEDESETQADSKSESETNVQTESEPSESNETAQSEESETQAQTNTGNISGMLWYDQNSDGTRDEGETGIASYPVYLYEENDMENAVQTVSTDANGEYAFTDIEPGTYVVGVKSNKLGTDYYLLPIVAVTGDNKLGTWSEGWDEKYSDAITIDTNSTVTNMDGGLRTPPGIQPMAAYTIDMSSVSAGGTGYTYSSNTVTFTTAAASHTYTITGTTTTKTIVVPTGVTVNITLSGLDIQTATSPIRLMGTAVANITLSGTTNILECTGTSVIAGVYQSGIYVAPSSKLTIGGAVSDTLTVKSGWYSAAIGGSYMSLLSAANSAGTINITGGTVIATGGTYGAGIGGGSVAVGNGGVGGAGGTITISGGTVTATGGSNCPGIGGGYAYNVTGSGTGGAGGTITISGGTVTATGGGNGTGIGGGNGGGAGGTGGTIKISGGTVIATSGSSGAGIGGGYSTSNGACTGGTGGTISISGGVVTATGGTWSAGIGGGGAASNAGGTAGAGGSITISGGTVTAVSAGGAGIGGARCCNQTPGGAGGTISISGGIVTATSNGGGSAGIGGGGSSSYPNGAGGAGGSITISGGTVTATGSTTNYGASMDIGYGSQGSGGTIVITGGSVLPTRGESYVYNPTNGTTNGGDTVRMFTLTSLASVNFSRVAIGSARTYTYSGTGHAAAGYIWLPLPYVTTNAATSISATPAVVTAPTTVNSSTSITATLNGTYRLINTYPVTNAYFEWGTSTSYTGGTRDVTSQVNTSLTTAGSYTVSDTLTKAADNLASGTTYHYRLVIVADGITQYGDDMTFTIPSLVPSVDVTHSAVTYTTATLSGIYDLNGDSFSSGVFEISADGGITWITLTSSTTPAVSSGTGVTAGTAQLDNSTTTPYVNLTGLNMGTTYQYRITVTNSAGANSKTGSFRTDGYAITEKFVDVSGTPVDASGLPDNIVYTTGSYTATGIPTTHTVGGSTYIYLGYKLGSYTAGDSYTSGTPSGVSITSNQDVYYIYAKAEGSIKVEKYDNDGTTLLPGAEFKLKKLTDTIASGGVVDTSFTSQTLSATSGTCTFSNLPEGVYQITETVAPAGYSLLKEPFEVIIPKDVTYASGVTPADLGYLYSTTDSGTGDVTYYYYDLTYKVTDQAELQMPVAGSGFLSQYYLWVGIGILCIAGVSFAFWWRRRRLNKKMV